MLSAAVVFARRWRLPAAHTNALFQHGRGNLNAAVTKFQARSLGGNGERRTTVDRQDGLRPFVKQPGLDPNHDRAGFGQCERIGGHNYAARSKMDRLEARRVDAGESRGHIMKLDAWPDRIGIGMNDPDKIGAIRPIQLAGDLDCDPLARTRREPVDITNQRDHGLNLGALYRCIG